MENLTDLKKFHSGSVIEDVQDNVFTLSVFFGTACEIIVDKEDFCSWLINTDKVDDDSNSDRRLSNLNEFLFAMPRDGYKAMREFLLDLREDINMVTMGAIPELREPLKVAI